MMKALSPIQLRQINLAVSILSFSVGTVFFALAFTRAAVTYPSFEFIGLYNGGPNQNQPVIGLYGQSNFNPAPIGPIGFYVVGVTRMGLVYWDRAVYQEMMTRGHNYVRWLEYALGAGPILYDTATILGVTEWITAGELMLLYICATCFWVCHENYSEGTHTSKPSLIHALRGKTNWVAFTMSSSVQVVVLAILARYLYLGSNTVPNFVLAQTIFALVFHVLIPILLYLDYTADYTGKVTGKRPREYSHTELGFLALLWIYMVISECTLTSGFYTLAVGS